MSRAEARVFLAEFVATAPGRLAAFRDVLAAAGGPTLDGTPDSLVPLWEWAVARATSPGPPIRPGESVPIWYDSQDQGAGAGASAEVLHLADGVACYFAEVIRAHVPHADWTVAHSRARNYAHQHKPVLSGFDSDLNPVHIVVLALSVAPRCRMCVIPSGCAPRSTPGSPPQSRARRAGWRW